MQAGFKFPLSPPLPLFGEMGGLHISPDFRGGVGILDTFGYFLGVISFMHTISKCVMCAHTDIFLEKLSKSPQIPTNFVHFFMFLCTIRRLYRVA